MEHRWMRIRFVLVLLLLWGVLPTAIGYEDPRVHDPRFCLSTNETTCTKYHGIKDRRMRRFSLFRFLPFWLFILYYCILLSLAVLILLCTLLPAPCSPRRLSFPISRRPLVLVLYSGKIIDS